MPSTVIHVITRLDHGGSAQNTMLTAIGHDRSRYEPLVVAGVPGRWDAQGGWPATQENCRLLEKEQIRWQLIPSLTREVNPIKDLHVLGALVRLLRKKKPAIVHTHTSKAGALGRLAAWIAGVPVVIHTPHGHVFYGHFGHLTTFMFFGIERMLARLTTRMIGLTDAERNEHLERRVGQAHRFAVVPSGIDLDRFRRAREGAAARPAMFRCPPDAIVVGSVGWLTTVKGHQYLIEAVAQLKSGYPNVHLVILGNGDLHKKLVGLADRLGLYDCVHFVGERTDVDACLAGMDIFVLPSLNEGMGRALIEAMVAGLPVVATKVGGIPALIEHDRTGLLVPPRDPDSLADALRRFLDDPEWAKQVGHEAGKSIGPRFGARAMVQAIEQLYEETLNEAGVR